MKKKFGISIASAIAMTLLIVSTVIGMSMAGLDGVWEFVEDGGNDSATCDAWATGEGRVYCNQLVLIYPFYSIATNYG